MTVHCSTQNYRSFLCLCLHKVIRKQHVCFLNTKSLTLRVILQPFYFYFDFV